MMKNERRWSRESDRAEMPASPLISCATSGEFLNRSVPLFPHLSTGVEMEVTPHRAVIVVVRIDR